MSLGKKVANTRGRDRTSAHEIQKEQIQAFLGVQFLLTGLSPGWIVDPDHPG